MLTADDLREISLSLPDAHERLTWGSHPTFRVRDKIFAIVSEDGESASIKATLAEQATLIAMDSETFSVASHVGRYGWVAVRLAGVDRDYLYELLVGAWRQTAPKRLARDYDAAGG